MSQTVTAPVPGHLLAAEHTVIPRPVLTTVEDRRVPRFRSAAVHVGMYLSYALAERVVLIKDVPLALVTDQSGGNRWASSRGPEKWNWGRHGSS